VRGYHGVTIAAASLTGIPTNHRDFDLPIAGILHTDCPDYYHDAKDGESEEEFASRLAGNLERLILAEGPETVAAFIAEPVMGAGGVIVPPASYFKKIQEVLRRHDVLLFDDEVICGFGRTGNMFGCETFGFEPDAMTLAKQLSSGYMPISAVLLTEEMHEVLADQSRKIGTFAHGFTYGGHPVPAAVALRTMELMEERDVLGHVRRVAPAFQARIGAYADHPLVGDTRGVGLLGAVELVADKSAKRAFEPTGTVGGHLAARAEAHGLITRNLGDTMAFCPPLIIQEDEIAELFDRFDRALDETQAWVERENLRAA
jgi:4-aminobutyrate--pyruvate transaminase